MPDALFAAVLTNRATRLDAVLAAPDGTVLRRTHEISPAPFGAEDLVTAYVRLAQNLRQAEVTEGHHITGAALALEAVLEVSVGKVVAMPMAAGWGAFPLGARLTTASGVPSGVAIVPLTDAALLGELSLGAGRGATSAVYLDLSRSVSAALCVDKRILHRPHLGAIGHIPVPGANWRCACGGSGHLETVASAQALVRWMIGRLPEAPATEAAVMRLTDGRAEALTASQIWQLACEGDPTAAELMGTANDALAHTILTLLLALDPERIILGGALALSGPIWRDALANKIAHLAPPARAADLAARLALGDLGPAATMKGAIMLARQRAGGAGAGG